MKSIMKSLRYLVQFLWHITFLADKPGLLGIKNIIYKLVLLLCFRPICFNFFFRVLFVVLFCSEEIFNALAVLHRALKL